MTGSPVLILDRDGTLIGERHYLGDPDGVEILEGVIKGLRAFKDAGFRLVVVTNQSGLARGKFTLDQMHSVNGRMRDELGKEGVKIDGLYFCPHGPWEGCDCRKPAPGLVLRAAKELGFDPENALVVGDKECDIELGRAVSAATCLVLTGYGRESLARGVKSDFIANDLFGLATTYLGLFETSPASICREVTP